MCWILTYRLPLLFFVIHFLAWVPPKSIVYAVPKRPTDKESVGCVDVAASDPAVHLHLDSASVLCDARILLNTSLSVLCGSVFVPLTKVGCLCISVVDIAVGRGVLTRVVLSVTSLLLFRLL